MTDRRGWGKSPKLPKAVQAVATAANRHLDAARARRAEVPRAALPALLPAIIAERWLKRLAATGFDPFAPALARPDPQQSWRLALAFWRRRF